MLADQVCERIDKLTSTYLELIASENWRVLYLDPADGRYWELSWPQGEMHGGGSPRLSVISSADAIAGYPRG